jgi:anti-anti-sigma factor
MNKQPFEATIRYQSDQVIIDLHGEIDAFAETGLTEAYMEAESHNPETIALNFSDVVYINSTGIALIVSLLAECRKSKRPLVVFGLSDHYHEIFKITRLADFMTIYEDEASALVG